MTKAIFDDKKHLELPAIEKRPTKFNQHGRTRIDNYAWLRDENWQDVLRDPAALSPNIRDALNAENAYYGDMTDDLEGLRKTLFAEMRGRIKENDESVPARDGDYVYWTKFREGGEYPLFIRARKEGGAEEIIYDGDEERKGAEFFSIGDICHSPNHKYIAIAVDRVGSEYFTIQIKDLQTGTLLDETIESADGDGAFWTADAAAFFYIERDDNQRAKRVKLHRLGEDPANDKLVYEEPDDMFYMSLSKSQDGQFVFINSNSITSSELRYLSATDFTAAPTILQPRTEKLEYSAEHRDGAFYILTNADGAVDFKIMKTPVSSPGKENWRDWVAHEAGRYILSQIAYKDYFIRLERRDALPRIVVADYQGDEYEVAFDEEAYSVGVDEGYEYVTENLRFSYSSPTTPSQVFDYNLRSRERVLRKTQEVPSGHDPSKYVAERIFATAADGAGVPITVLRLKETPKDGSAPAVLYGYGAYGISIPASFSTTVLSLVDRGVVYAIAHPRGGSERGRQWYLEGKLDNKMNSFTDFIAAGEALVSNGYTQTGKIVIYGGSAGGLLVGAAVNLRPDLFSGVIAAVPFVDVITTISDDTLPLTPPEWEEWGNPIESEEQYNWIAAYSPYDNISAKDYPPIMATGGLTDYRVTYWEPAKWIARLRDDAKGGPFVLRMNMGAGHAGSAARFERLDEQAHLFAFALKVSGKAG